MQIHYSLHKLPLFNNPIITIGTFDGIHFGHRQLINQLISEAKKVGVESILITFEPHPRLILNPDDNSLKILSTLAEKINILENLGIQHLVVVPFTLEFAKQTAIEYIENFLVKKFHPSAIIIGHDHQFGMDRSGDFNLLHANKIKYNYNLIEIDKQLLQEITVSSSEIRRNLTLGNVAIANKLLVNNYTLAGTVVHGFAKGTTIGFPTANISIDNALKLIPAIGVYAVIVYIQKIAYKGMLNIGVRPTVSDGNTISLEVHLFDFAEDIYGEKIKLEVITKMRDEIKFKNIESLVTQLNRDASSAKEILRNLE
jgi:riboflavin kinase / FMN adenylyltransferase